MENLIPNRPNRPENRTEEEKARIEKAKEGSVKALAVFGMICLLALVSVGIIKIAPAIIRGLASATVSVSSAIVPTGQNTNTQAFNITTNEYSVGSGQEFLVSWSQPTGQNGSFTLSYPCVNGMHLEAVGQADGSVQSANTVIYCNTDFQFLNDNNSIALEGFLAAPQTTQATENGQAPSSVQVPITIHFTPNGSANESGSATVNVALSSSAEQAVTTQQTPSSASSAQTESSAPSATLSQGQATNSIYPIQTESAEGYTPNTNADLAVTILATGIIDPTTNAFVPEDTVQKNDRAAIQFEISNIGGHATGSWSFSAVLPTYPAYTFMSNAQPSLNPGEKIVYTIGFDQLAVYPGNPADTFIINADNTDSVTETNKANNIVHGMIYVENN